MLAGAGLQHGTRVFITQLRIPDDAGNGANGQAMPGFAVHAKNADGVGYGEHFKIQRQGMDGKALLQKCARLENVTHAALPFVEVHSSGNYAREGRAGQDKKVLELERVPSATRS